MVHISVQAILKLKERKKPLPKHHPSTPHPSSLPQKKAI